MSNKGDTSKRFWAKIIDKMNHFAAQPLTHFKDILISIIFVNFWTQKQWIGVQKRDIIFKQSHVVGGALEPVGEHVQVDSFVVLYPGKGLILLDIYILE